MHATLSASVWESKSFICQISTDGIFTLSEDKKEIIIKPAMVEF